MARGNQRDKAREKTQAKLASQVCPYLCILPDNTDQNADTGKKNQKSGNTMSGSEQQRAKEAAAEIMRKKQAAGEFILSIPGNFQPCEY